MFRRWREECAPEMVEMQVAGVTDPVRLPADAVRAIAAHLMPVLLERGSATLIFGAPGGTMPERPTGLIPGSGRRGEPKALDAMISARFDAGLAARAREIATAD